jgi:excinuclease ABC subunit B
MSEELARYMGDLGIKVNYIHSEIDALARIDILRDLRLGKIDVLVGINLLREGLDLPEVALVAILDADKEGFLRSERSFIQIAGRAARNSEGRVILYADRITKSMQKLIDETERRRAKQIAYNEAHGIIPQTVVRAVEESMNPTAKKVTTYTDLSQDDNSYAIAADPIISYMSKPQLETVIAETKRNMEEAASKLDFISAAKFRDELFALEKVLKTKV